MANKKQRAPKVAFFQAGETDSSISGIENSRYCFRSNSFGCGDNYVV
jgi:hypothetical protein